jgi:hypothetical protein
VASLSKPQRKLLLLLLVVTGTGSLRLLNMLERHLSP